MSHVIDCPKDCDACRLETDLNEALAALRAAVDRYGHTVTCKWWADTPCTCGAEMLQADAKAILAKHGDVK